MRFNVFDLKMNEDIIKELNRAKKVEIYLIKERAESDKKYRDTFVCSMVYLKTDNNQYFRVEGIEEDFGSNEDEVFGITLKKGWLKYEVKDHGTEILFKEDQLKDTTNLYLYDVFIKKAGSHIEIISYIDTFEEVYQVEVDEGILFKRNNNQSIYIGLDNAPIMMVVTKDRRYIEELVE